MTTYPAYCIVPHERIKYNILNQRRHYLEVENGLEQNSCYWPE